MAISDKKAKCLLADCILAALLVRSTDVVCFLPVCAPNHPFISIQTILLIVAFKTNNFFLEKMYKPLSYLSIFLLYEDNESRKLRYFVGCMTSLFVFDFCSCES